MRHRASGHFKLTNPNKAMTVITDKRSKRESIDSGKVVTYLHTAIIYGAVFKVATDTQRRIAAGSEAKSVHARVWGTIESPPGRIRPTETMQSHGGSLTVEVHYNPRRAGFFHYWSDGVMVPVHSAPVVGFSTAANGQGRCWVAPTR